MLLSIDMNALRAKITPLICKLFLELVEFCGKQPQNSTIY